MVVARKSKKQDNDHFRLQIYKTRVIPEIEDETTKKKPSHEIRLDPKTTRVNLYSSLDKTVVVWHPYKKGTRILVMRPSSLNARQSAPKKGEEPGSQKKLRGENTEL